MIELNVKLITLALFTNIFLVVGCNEFGNKSEYGVLQEELIAEAKQPNTTNGVVIKVRRNNYILAGFRAENGNERIWVLLNSSHSPYYKQIPQKNFTISSSDLDSIRSIDGVSETVLAVLETRVRNK